MKKAIVVASAMISLIGSAFGCNRELNPAYISLALPYMQTQELKLCAQAYANENIALHKEIQLRETICIPSLSKTYNNTFSEDGGSPIEKIANTMILTIVLSTNRTNAGLSHVLYHLIGHGTTAISYDDLGSIANMEDFNAACKAATEAKDAKKIKLLFGFIAETVDTGNIGNIYQTNCADPANPFIVVTEGGTVSPLKGSTYENFKEALNILTFDAYEEYKSSLNKAALAHIDPLLQSIAARIGITTGNIGDLYNEAE